MSKTNENAMKILLMAAAMSEGGSMMFSGNDEEIKIVSKEPKEPIPHKGVKEYFFNERGEFSTEQMLKSETVFKCYAINDKNAKRKFSNFIKNKR